MKKPGSHASTFTPHSVIPDNAPAIAVGLEYGRSLPASKIVDIDYKALDIAMTNLDSPPDRSDLTVIIAGNELAKETHIGGTYNNRLKKICLSPTLAGDPSGQQGVLLHEIQHYSDHQSNNLNTLPKKVMRRLGNLGTRLAFPSIGLYLATWSVYSANQYYASKNGAPVFDPELLQDVNTFTLGVAGANLGLRIYHMFNPWEARAHRASHVQFPTIIHCYDSRSAQSVPTENN